MTRSNTELREAAHKAMDGYLDSGGPSDFIIISRKDHDRNWKSAQLQLLSELLEQKKTYDTLRTNKPWSVEAVPVSVIDNLKKGLSG